MPAKKYDIGETKSADQAQEDAADIPQQSEPPVVKDQIQLKSQMATGLAQPPLSGGEGFDAEDQIRPATIRGSIDAAVTMRRTATEATDDLPLWVVIRKASEAISFDNYSLFIDLILCGDVVAPERLAERLKKFPARLDSQNAAQTFLGVLKKKFQQLQEIRFLPFTDTDSYRLLKVATEAFLMVNCGVALNNYKDLFNADDAAFVNNRVRLDLQPSDLTNLWLRYLEDVNGVTDAVVPYLSLIREKLRDVPLVQMAIKDIFDEDTTLPQQFSPAKCLGILLNKLTSPCLLELIWSYWHEEGMLAQTLNAISLRFQNVRGPGEGNPLAMMEIDPLRPLNNLIWGYIQDEQHRLSVLRRVYEYDHHYGLMLYGKAAPEFRPADSRSKFLEAFHVLLYLTSIFYLSDDDTMVIADAFPVLHALKEVHFLLAEGAHGQFGDLPSTARQEMLIQQWILARPEFREFLPTRIMVAYPEPWMDRVDAMKTVQGWTDTSVLHFRNLGVFGERVLLSVRFGNWGAIEDPVQARNWARFWRAEIQGYIHAYRAVTGVDLTSEITDSRQAQARYMQPSFHLRQRLAAQQRNLPQAQSRMLGTGDGPRAGIRSNQLAVPKRTN